MKLLKKIGLAIATLVLALLVAALFIKKEYTVERTVTVNRSTNEVFQFIRYTRNQDQYNKWIMSDPAVKKEYKGTDGTKGFIYAWDGNRDVGKGEQEITDIREGDRIDFYLRFIRPFEGKENAWMITRPLSADETSIKWGMRGRSTYPLNLVNLFVPSVLGKDLETSLNTLKHVLEK